MRLAVCGLLLVSAVSLGFDAMPREVELPGPGEDLLLALPVPIGARVLQRTIDHVRGRSLLAIDLDPTDPPTSRDTVVLLRMEPIAGVLLARVVDGGDLTQPSSPSDWWTFPHRGDVMVTSHPTVRDAESTFGAVGWSGNHRAGSSGGSAIPASRTIDPGESRGSTRVEARFDR